MDFFDIPEKLKEKINLAEQNAEKSFKKIDEITEYNQQKVLKAFIDNGVSESHFTESTGYGYDDRGRNCLDRTFAQIFGAEDALVRHTITCGTHAIGTMLFALLRNNDTILSVTDTPYDTLHSTLGLNDAECSLKEFGVIYDEVKLTDEGRVDYQKIEERLKKSKVKMVYIQRSRGYSTRPSLKVEEIEKIAKLAKSIQPDVIVAVDNCYGEFAQCKEPTEVGADIMAGSLIKNAGGGIAKNGGYIVGRKDLVEKCAYRHTVPGLGREVGATLGHTRELFMGLFNAPHVVGEAMKTAVFTASLFETLGFKTSPTSNEDRGDIIETLFLQNEERLIAFCQGLQKGAPVDSFVEPNPSEMPGYDSKVIMSAGTFTMGSSIELSADAPLRPPYAVWMQGGLNYHSAKVGISLAANEIYKRNLNLD
jgi:cystathionine beta-lyase family protein involved in aluminum resistance